MPLSSIRVFVEAARQLSFSRAARLLGMTQSGVSHHVAALERHFGQPLFARLGASVSLTDAGRRYFETVREAMSTIELSTQHFNPGTAGRLVIRTSLYTLATTVLIPALPHFSPVPPLAVDVVTSLSPPLPGDVYDVLISRDLSIDDDGHWLLATEELVCVAAPALQRQFAGVPVARWPFLSARSRPDVLAFWAQQQQVDSGDIQVRASFEHYFLALPAALAGMGFLVIPRVLLAGLLGSGQLREAPNCRVRGTATYKAYINPLSGVPDAAKGFCRWLKATLRGD